MDMKKKRIFITLVLIFIMLFTGCAKKSASTPQSTNKASYNDAARSATSGTAQSNMSASEANKSTDSNGGAAPTIVNAPEDDSRKVIYNARSSISVKDLKGAFDSITAKTISMGGYVSSSNLGQDYSEITIKIPALQFTGFISYLNTIGESREVSTSTNDITEQYTDAKSRVKNLQAQEEQLLTIMKKANTIDEILKVQNELSNVRGNIEVLQGKINMWDKLVEMSTITISLSKVKEIGGKEVKVSFISWGEIAKAISNGFNSTLNFVTRFFSGIFIILISAIPVIPFVALAAWLIIRYRKKSKKNISQ
jgi:hypothetical protein